MSMPPFSARNQGAHAQIDNDCPESARTGLLHLLYATVERKYVGWPELARELQRIARLTPGRYSPNYVPAITAARDDATAALFQLPWDNTFDFCERLYSHLVHEVSYHDGDQLVVVSSKADAQRFVAEEVQRVFIEEHLVRVPEILTPPIPENMAGLRQ